MDFYINDKIVIADVFFAELLSVGIFHLDMGKYLKFVNSRFLHPKLTHCQ